ncbi:MAG TPA: M15 family metallopeptidase, partial [Acidimicrobiales bacterium]
EDQIRLRAAHCGGHDHYSVYERPSSECHPPTARPGQSMHERGLAVDFTCAGSLIGDHGNRCYQWLAANAATYGFYNLPSEAWHWSINGR